MDPKSFFSGPGPALALISDSGPALELISDPGPALALSSNSDYVTPYLICHTGPKNSPPKFELHIIYMLFKNLIYLNLYISNALYLLVEKTKQNLTWIRIRI